MSLRSVWTATVLVAITAVYGQELRTVDGRSYTVHRVEAGQTLYAISRSYAVPVDALLQANPGAAAGLSIGQEVLVPRDAVDRKEVRTAPKLLRDGELLHTVAKRETLFGIARNYGVDVNDLLERNPELNTGLREGMTVVVPTSKVTGQQDAAVRPAVQEELVEHTVQPGETLFGLGQRYGVLPERIQAANELPEGLKAGMVIRIPVKAGTVVQSTAPRVDPVAPGRHYKVAVLLPFALDRNDSLVAASPLGKETRPYASTLIAAQFYAGLSLALDSLEREGLNAEVLVLDMGEDPRAWAAMAKRSDLKDVDLFIGPFHRGAIEEIARAIPKAHIVCPVQQSNKVVLGNPTVSKVTATRSDLVRHTAQYVASRHARDNVILVRPDIHADKDAQDQMFRELNAAMARQPARFRDSVMVVRTGRRDIGNLAGKLESGRTNVVVVPSDDVEFVTSLVTKLRPLAAKQPVVLVGMESWLAMETVAATDLEQLGFMHATAVFADHGDPRVQAFVAAFRARFTSDADEYAFLGYDVGRFYLTALKDHGTAFPDHFGSVRTEPLHMHFRMTRTGPENGFRNEAAVMLKQQDLRWVKAP